MGLHNDHRPYHRRMIPMQTILKNRSTQFIALLCILNLILASCSNSPATATALPPNVPTQISVSTPASATGAYWPTEAWRTSTPEQQGMRSEERRVGKECRSRW